MSEGENYPITWIKKATINILDTDVASKRIIKLKHSHLFYLAIFSYPLFFCAV